MDRERKKERKSRSRVIWTAVPVAPLLVILSRKNEVNGAAAPEGLMTYDFT